MLSGRGLARLAGLAGTLVLLGCPYESKTPLGDAATATLDTRLVGRWRCVASDSEEPATVSFTARGREYDVVLSPGGDEAPTRFRAFVSDVGGGRRVLDVQDVKKSDEDGDFYLVRYTLHGPRVLELDIADEGAFAKGAAPRAVVERGLDGDAVFGDFCVCARILESPASPAPAR